MNYPSRLLPALLILLFIGFSSPAKADPPSRIGRINYINGSVSFERGDLDEWSPAAINYPMTTGDHLWTDTRARAELHVGSNVIRLAPETEFSFLNLDDQTLQVRLSEGSMNIRLHNLLEDEVVEIDTPNSAISLLRTGEYRIDVDIDGNTTITTWRGEAEVTAAGSAFPVRSRESGKIYGYDDPSYDLVSVPAADEFDKWALERDRREEQSVSVRYVSREMVGYEDLDNYGRWQNLPEYGNVWVPTSVPAGWAPYRTGHWVWVEPWGWTWVDEQPWGFAPFHYGRWAYVGNTWYWVPGQVVARPVYAPALVAFVGGNNWSASLSFGNNGGVAWFPLGPREVYVPSYHVSESYARNINVTHVNVTNINVINYNVTNVNYVNRSAVTAVPHNVFVGAQPVAAAAVVVPVHVINAAPVVGTTVAIAPQRQSLVVHSTTTTNIKVSRPPTQIQTRPVVAKVAPPPPPVPFAAREKALNANPGKPLDEKALKQARETAPKTTASAPPQPVVKPAAAPAPASGKPGHQPGLRPAREGLPQPKATQTEGFKPNNGNPTTPANPTNAGNPTTPANPGNTGNPANPGHNRERRANQPGQPAGQPTDAKPADAKPADAKPANPTPANPTPANPTPANPGPVNRPGRNRNTQPVEQPAKPADANPVQPGPAKPTPAKPTPAQPEKPQPRPRDERPNTNTPANNTPANPGVNKPAQPNQPHPEARPERESPPSPPARPNRNNQPNNNQPADKQPSNNQPGTEQPNGEQTTPKPGHKKNNQKPDDAKNRNDNKNKEGDKTDPDRQ